MCMVEKQEVGYIGVEGGAFRQRCQQLFKSQIQNIQH